MNDAPTFEYRHGIATVSDGDAQLRITRFRAEHRDDSVRAELIATCAGRGLARAAWNLTSPRDTKALVEHLVRQADHVRWAQLLQFSAWQAIDAFRAGAPLERTGRRAPTDDRVLLAPLLWRGQPTILYGPGGVGKSLLAAGIAVAVQTGQQLVPGLEPRARGPALILDWETDCDTWNSALQAVCAGVGLEPVEVLYQRMYRPLRGRRGGDCGHRRRAPGRGHRRGFDGGGAHPGGRLQHERTSAVQRAAWAGDGGAGHRPRLG